MDMYVFFPTTLTLANGETLSVGAIEHMTVEELEELLGSIPKAPGLYWMVASLVRYLRDKADMNDAKRSLSFFELMMLRSRLQKHVASPQIPIIDTPIEPMAPTSVAFS
jgi:hypothetical protein